MNVKSLLLIAIGAVAIFGLSLGIGMLVGTKMFAKAPTTYEECVAQGNPVQESYPAVCVTKDGTRFTQEVIEEDTPNALQEDSVLNETQSPAVQETEDAVKTMEEGTPDTVTPAVDSSSLE
jgi:hypothetical protein